MDRLRALHDFGVSIWLDTLSRELLETGAFADLIDRGVTGATSNPSIFAKAIVGSGRYQQQLRRLSAGVPSDQDLFLDLALTDVRTAADLLRPVFDATAGADGFVSFECTPDLADDSTATIAQARDLWARLDRPNTMIKVPATAAGIASIQQLTTDGVNVNVTLLFSIDRYRQVSNAFLTGLEARLAAGLAIDQISSVASFFVSRVDSAVDDRLPAASPSRGRAAIANAAVAFETYRRTIGSDRWNTLANAGGRPQRLLWASTGTKNVAYSDVLYVDSLIADGVVNTMPIATIDAFADHGTIADTLTDAYGPALELLEDLHSAGIDLDEITRSLERDGVNQFNDAYAQILSTIVERRDAQSDVAAASHEEPSCH